MNYKVRSTRPLARGMNCPLFLPETLNIIVSFSGHVTLVSLSHVCKRVNGILSPEVETILKRDDFPDIFSFLIEGNYLTLLEWVIELFPRRVELLGLYILEKSCEFGNLPLMKRFFLHCPELGQEGTYPERCVYTPRMARLAARKGNLDILKYLHEHYPSLFLGTCAPYAAREGRLEVLQWIKETFSCIIWDEAVLEEAFYFCATRALDDCTYDSNTLSFLNWVIDNYYPCNSKNNNVVSDVHLCTSKNNVFSANIYERVLSIDRSTFEIIGVIYIACETAAYYATNRKNCDTVPGNNFVVSKNCDTVPGNNFVVSKKYQQLSAILSLIESYSFDVSSARDLIASVNSPDFPPFDNPYRERELSFVCRNYTSGFRRDINSYDTAFPNADEEHRSISLILPLRATEGEYVPTRTAARLFGVEATGQIANWMLPEIYKICRQIQTRGVLPKDFVDECIKAENICLLRWGFARGATLIFSHLVSLCKSFDLETLKWATKIRSLKSLNEIIELLIASCCFRISAMSQKLLKFLWLLDEYSLKGISERQRRMLVNEICREFKYLSEDEIEDTLDNLFERNILCRGNTITLSTATFVPGFPASYGLSAIMVFTVRKWAAKKGIFVISD